MASVKPSPKLSQQANSGDAAVDGARLLRSTDDNGLVMATVCAGHVAPTRYLAASTVEFGSVGNQASRRWVG